MVSSVCLPCAVQLMELQGDMTGVSLQEVTWCQEHVVHCSSGFFFIIIIVFLLWKAIKTFSLPLWRNNTEVTVQTVHDDSIFYLVLLTNTHIPSCIFCKCSIFFSIDSSGLGFFNNYSELLFYYHVTKSWLAYVQPLKPRRVDQRRWSRSTSVILDVVCYSFLSCSLGSPHI